MCQYSAVDGCTTDWHTIHLGQLALSGAALVTIEATAVVPEGRISYADVGLWDDKTEAAMRATLASVRCWSAIPIAIQLAHAGRKACTEVPWKGGEQLPPGDPCGWQAQAPSPLSFAPEENTPDQLSKQRMNELKDAFAAAARRADGLADQLTAEHGGRFVSAPPGSSRGGQAVRCCRGKRLGSPIQQCHFCCCRSAGVLDRDPPARCQSDQAQWQLHDHGGCRRDGRGDDPCGEGQCYAQQTSRGSDWNIIWGAGVP